MKYRCITMALFLGALGFCGCKKFLNVQPLDRLAGNSFFIDREDVESNVWDVYGLFRDKIGQAPLLPWAGDLRSGMMAPSPEEPGREYRYLIPQNALDIVTTDNTIDYYDLFENNTLRRWDGFYKIIQAANDLYYELDRKPIDGVSASDIKRYKGEMVFMRCLAYFFMVRQWGDVPYYTDAYHQEALPRLDMVEVVNNCLKDLTAVKDDLPWSYSDPAFLGVRATRGSVIALMMNLAMWNAGFDKENAAQYWQQTAELGGEMVASGVFDLLPIEKFNELFKGRTKESLFEVVQNSNYGELIGYKTFADMVLHYPYKRPISEHHYSFTYFRSSFLKVLYPTGEADARRQYWFDENMMADNGNFQFLKFTNVYAIADNEDVNPDNDIMIFRYAGLLLLRAEALAHMGNDAEAIKMLNIVRARAQAPLYAGAGGERLLDVIFIERAKELMGEGHYYYDLIRTGRVVDQRWDYYPLTQTQFDRGGWTWPLDAAVQNNNPYINLNSYWLK